MPDRPSRTLHLAARTLAATTAVGWLLHLACLAAAYLGESHVRTTPARSTILGLLVTVSVVAAVTNLAAWLDRRSAAAEDETYHVLQRLAWRIQDRRRQSRIN